MLILQIRIRLFFMSTLVWASTIARPVIVCRSAIIGECCIINPTLFGLRKHLVIGQLVFLCDFYWSPSIGKPRMTPVFFAKTTESYEGFIGYTTNRQISYESGILRQDYGLIRGLPINRTRIADIPIRTETGVPNDRTRLCCPCIAALLNPTFLTPFCSNPG